MKLLKLVILGSLLSLMIPTVFAFEPLQIDPDLVNIIDRPILLDEIHPIIPEEEVVYIDDPSVFTKLRGALNDDGTVSLKWEAYLKPDFLWYKIIHSQEKKELIYPRDGYIDFYDIPSATAWDHDDVPLGSNFYRVCIITTDNRRGCSNQLAIVKEKPTISAGVEQNEPKPDTVTGPKDQLPQKDVPSTIQAEKQKGTLLKWIGQLLIDGAQVWLAILALILAATGFTFAAKRKQKSISKYINEIDNTYTEFKMKSKRCEAELYRLRDIIDEQLKNGKLDDSAYQLLMNRIEGYMVEVQKMIVNEKFGGLPENLKNELFNMMESGDISESEYEKFQNLITKSELSGNDQSTLLKTVKDFQKQGDKLKRKGSKDV